MRILAGMHFESPVSFLEAAYRVFVSSWLPAQTDVFPGPKLIRMYPFADLEWRFHIGYVSMS